MLRMAERSALSGENGQEPCRDCELVKGRTLRRTGKTCRAEWSGLCVQYINNLWRVDPSSFAATLNMICMRAPALMQRLMDHEVSAANAAIGQYGNLKITDVALSGSAAEPRKELVPGRQQLPQPQQPQQQHMSALQDPDELEVGRTACVMALSGNVSLILHLCAQSE